MRRQKQFAVFHQPVFHRDWGRKGKRQKIGKDNEKTKTVCSVSLARVSQGLGSDGRGRRRAGTTFQHLLQAQKSQTQKITLHAPKITFERTNNLKTKNIINIIKSHF